MYNNYFHQIHNFCVIFLAWPRPWTHTYGLVNIPGYNIINCMYAGSLQAVLQFTLRGLHFSYDIHSHAFFSSLPQQAGTNYQQTFYSLTVNPASHRVWRHFFLITVFILPILTLLSAPMKLCKWRYRNWISLLSRHNRRPIIISVLQQARVLPNIIQFVNIWKSYRRNKGDLFFTIHIKVNLWKSYIN